MVPCKGQNSPRPPRLTRLVLFGRTVQIGHALLRPVSAALTHCDDKRYDIVRLDLFTLYEEKLSDLILPAIADLLS